MHSILDFFSETSLAQIILVALIVLLALNQTVYPLVMLGSLVVVVICCILALYGLGIFAVMLLAVEVHVFYVVLCLALTWYRFDTVRPESVTSSRSLNALGVAVVALLSVALTLGAGFSTKNSMLYEDSYVYGILLYAVEDYAGAHTINTAAVAYLMACAYTAIMSFEFFALNIIMLVAVLVFFNIHTGAKRSILRNAGIAIAEVSSIMSGNNNIIRSQNQAAQLRRSTSARCVDASRSSGSWLYTKGTMSSN